MDVDLADLCAFAGVAYEVAGHRRVGEGSGAAMKPVEPAILRDLLAAR